MLKLNITQILNLKGIKRKYTYLRQKGISNHKIRHFLNGTGSSVKISDIEKLCTFLNCTPNDLFTFNLQPGEEIPDNHPLRTLEKNIDLDITNLTDDMSIAELKEFSKKLSELKRAVKNG